MTDGFYKFADGELLYGKNVFVPGYDLTPETRDDYQYPVDGWSWFENEESARAALITE